VASSTHRPRALEYLSDPAGAAAGAAAGLAIRRNAPVG
jgi:hypothetical protein